MTHLHLLKFQFNSLMNLTCSRSSTARSSSYLQELEVVLDQCCQPCSFPTNLGLFFVDLRGFLKTFRLLVFGLVLIKIYSFFGLVFCRCLQIADCFFIKFHGQFPLSIYFKMKFGLFLCKFAHFGLVFFGFASLFLY